MIVVDLDAATVARTRLAVSPLAEVVACLRLVTAGRRDAVFGDVGAGARSALAHPDVRLAARLVPPGGHGYLPDFLTPKPRAERDVLVGQLDAVASTPTADVRTQVLVERYAGKAPDDVRRAVDRGSLAPRVASGLARLWSAALADRWSELSRILDADLARRSRDLATGGVAALLGSLHPDIGFDGRSLRVSLPPYEEHGSCRDTEVVVCPALFGWPRVSTQLCHPDQAVLRYPAMGLGVRAPSRGRPLAELMGGTRAAILRGLAAAASTDDVARRQQVSPATASYHLGVLYRCGLVERTREGHRVTYRRSPRGDALLG